MNTNIGEDMGMFSGDIDRIQLRRRMMFRTMMA